MSIGDDRVQTWRNKLVGRLQNEVEGNQISKLSWLVSHFEEYLDRWLAFAETETISVSSTLRNDTFYVVLAPISVLKLGHYRNYSTPPKS